MKTTGYQLCDLLRKTAEETANPERAQIMLWAADEVERLINEVRILEKEKSRLEGEISEMESISLANVKEHAPPSLESESAATEELHGGCCVSSCSESSFGDAAKSISENLARAVNAATQSAFQQVGERLKHQPPPGQDRSASEPNVPYRK